MPRYAPFTEVACRRRFSATLTHSNLHAGAIHGAGAAGRMRLILNGRKYPPADATKKSCRARHPKYGDITFYHTVPDD